MGLMEVVREGGGESPENVGVTVDVTLRVSAEEALRLGTLEASGVGEAVDLRERDCCPEGVDSADTDTSRLK